MAGVRRGDDDNSKLGQSGATFEEVNRWINDLNTLCLPNAVVLLVGNKNDLVMIGFFGHGSRRVGQEI
jgi:hypothetical protein